MNKILRTLTAAGLALSLALGAVTASAAPARANNDEAVAIIGGLIALFALGQAMRNDNRQAVPQHQPQPQRQHGHQPQRQHGHRPAPLPHNRLPLVAPARCFIEGNDHSGYFRGYVRRCMQNNVARPAALPGQCLRRVETHRGPRMIYGGRCLAQNGWQREPGFRP